jgi:hypothetical protein
MGGYTVTTSEIDSELEWYTSHGRILLLLEPCSPLENSYNVSALFENDAVAVLEIVGPGFDASDLQRGHLSPHERIRLDLTKTFGKRRATETGLESSIIERTLIDDQAYQDSVRYRLCKVYRKLRLREKYFTGEIYDQELERKATAWLAETKMTTLLEHSTGYKPIEKSTLILVIKSLQMFLRFYDSHCSLRFPCVLAGSFVNRGTKFVFWDVVDPARKYDLERRKVRG